MRRTPEGETRCRRCRRWTPDDDLFFDGIEPICYQCYKKDQEEIEMKVEQALLEGKEVKNEDI